MQGLDWQTWRMNFTAGLGQKTSPRMLAPPALEIARDVQYDTVGDLETRYPYFATENEVEGGGVLEDVRRIVPNGDELLVFTKDGLYSQNGNTGKWILRGTHLAVEVDEQPVFVTPGEQRQCDRAELGGIVVYAWMDAVSENVYAAAVTKETGAVVVPPTNLAEGGSDVLWRPRVVALDTVILLLCGNITTGNIDAIAIDPADPVTSLDYLLNPRAGVGSASYNSFYDVVAIPGDDAALLVQRLLPTTSYAVTRIPADVSTTLTATEVARTCDGPIAVSIDPNVTHAQIVRANGTNIQGDLLLLSDFSDVYTAQAIGTVTTDCQQIAAAHRSTQDSGVYRCYVFWENGESDTPGTSGGQVKYNWVSTGNTLGTQALFAHTLGIASRAFDHEGRVFVNLVAAPVSTVTTSYAGVELNKAALQNTYFLFRDDAFVCAKQAMNRAGGFDTQNSWLPGVAVDPDDSNAYHWCGTERRIVPVGADPVGAYSDRGPRDITLTFDSNDARRCVRLGETLYIACGEGLLAYDGLELVEVGFFQVPYAFALTTTTGSIVNGVYFYKATARAQNARGDVDRSTTAAAGGIEITSGPDGVQLGNLSQVYLGHRSAVSIEVWRTLVNPTDDAPYYKVSGSSPTDTTPSNNYLENDADGSTVDFVDELADASVRVREQHYEAAGVLENMQPPACSIVVASDTRIFLAGIAGDPDRVWYSKQRGDGEVAAFNDLLVVSIPAGGGAITGLGFMGETLVVFRETAVYALAGDGYDNAGGGQNFVVRRIPGNCGAVNHESIAEIERGLLFKSSKGWYLLNRGFALEYIGGPVRDFDGEIPLAIDVVKHQVRIVLSFYDEWGVLASTEDPAELGDRTTRMIVLDTQGGQWFEWSIDGGLHSCVYQGTHFYLTSSGPMIQLVTYSGVDYDIDVETAWIDLAAMQGYGRVRYLEAHGEYLSAHTVQVRLARDHWADGVDTYFDDETWTATPTTAGGPLELEHGPSIPQVNQLKVRLTITPTDGGAGCKLSYLDFELGFKRGLYRRLPEAQRQ